MALFESTLALLLGAVILTGVARRVGVPYPSLLAIAGATLAFVPAGPELEIEPDLALALFVAPVLLDAAFDTSPRDLRRNAIPLASLVIVAVGLTTAAVAWVGWRLGGLPIAAAVALGAIVAPPDAAAAAAVLGRLRLPQRILHVLQGESLLNDATALVVYRIAVGAAVGTVIQGFTLRPLLDRLGFEADGGVGQEISRGRLGIMQAALDTLGRERSPAAAAVREGYLAAREVAANPDEPQGATEHDRLRLRAITAQRLTLLRLREEGVIGDEAFHRLEEELDCAELCAAPAGSFQPLMTDGEPPRPRT